MKRLLSITICMILIYSLFCSFTFALETNGQIDLYEVFSNKKDKAKTEVGSQIYKWSMYLPDDAMIFKSERANYFRMSTNSYQASVTLEINKNESELTLEDLLYKIQNNSRDDIDFWGWGDKEFSVDIVKENGRQPYIRIVKTDQDYDYILVDEAAEEFRDYIENRIYIANNYIYDLTVRMSGEFYREHKEMFEKLVSSFKPYFDKNNPRIKDLSDSVSISREYKNTSYGWKLMISPYWKVKGVPNARYQKFSRVYTDEELNQEDKSLKEKKDEDMKNIENLTVSLISSAQQGETAEKWAQKEIEFLKDNYNSRVYEIIKSESKTGKNFDAYELIVKYNTITNNPYIVHNLYVIGNGYKYLVSAKINEKKYNDENTKANYKKMIDSFKLDRSCLSKMLGKIVAAETLMDLNAVKELKMKKYDFKTKVTKSWNVSKEGFGEDYYYDRFIGFSDDFDFWGSEGVKNYENISAFEPNSNINLDMFAGLNANDMHEIITKEVEAYKDDDEIKMGLAQVKIQSTQHNGAEIYCIEKEYDLEKIQQFVSKDKTKNYDLKNIFNEYKYIIKIDKDIFTEKISIPVANMTDKNKEKIQKIWKNTVINKMNYGNIKYVWKTHKLEEFDDKSQKN
ncbi:hypothetical protein SAMN02745883_00591 [Caminicella sporogenes DSM 14501]|uniref:Uncharacterized protein n=1 Tax=Caminicella sporogenes DSM 14501 TaxID=1121266 RepID=A0A1M6MKG4_9FIRM|nr:hypothetical protein [Caminicella sporogenes]RKD27509.1 hypothetical protein BET04_00095 [Caminicella sporogenes]SHJ83958.1 hypothetical protein SAMN02745883_00591 [Caminicella sporogenes DSM 14501]